MDIRLGLNQFTTIHLDGVEDDDSHAWVADDATIVKLTPDEDNRSCRVEAASAYRVGKTCIRVANHSDMNAPSLAFDVEIVADPVKGLWANVDPPSDKD